MRFLPLFTTAVTLALVPGIADAQVLRDYPRADQLTVRVDATASLLGGDTVQASYSLFNNAASQQRAKYFLIRTNQLPVFMDGPSTGFWLRDAKALQDSLAIVWLALDSSSYVLPGDSAVGLLSRAVGELNIVKYYARGHVPVPEADDSVEWGPPASIWVDAKNNYTIAVVPLGNMGASNLMERLSLVVSKACMDIIDFIQTATICTNPNSRPRLADQATDQGNIPAACGHMAAMITEVAALPSSDIKPEGRALLTTRAQQFQRRYCP